MSPALTRRLPLVLVMVLTVVGVLTVAPARADTRDLCVQADHVWVMVVAADGSLAQACSTKGRYAPNQHLQGAGFTAEFVADRVTKINGVPSAVTAAKQWRVYYTTHYFGAEWQPWALIDDPEGTYQAGVIQAWVYVDATASAAEGRPPIPLPANQPMVSGDIDYNGQADVFVLNGQTRGLQYLRVLGNRLDNPSRPSDVTLGRNPVALIPSAGGSNEPDLLTVDEAGRLFRYDGFSGTPQQIGTGWRGMRKLLALPDIDGDGRAELLALTGDGQLVRYRFDAEYRLAKVGAIGRNWGAVRTIASVGDFSGDGVADLLAINSSGDLMRYDFTRSGTITATTRVGVRWDTVRSISVRGDLTNDGRPDLLAWNANWEIRVYPVAGPGRWGTPKVLATNQTPVEIDSLVG